MPALARALPPRVKGYCRLGATFSARLAIDAASGLGCPSNDRREAVDATSPLRDREKTMINVKKAVSSITKLVNEINAREPEWLTTDWPDDDGPNWREQFGIGNFRRPPPGFRSEVQRA
jgi:hypothetical protein